METYLAVDIGASSGRHILGWVKEGRLCLEFAGGLFTVYGDGLRIETLAAHRITLRGRFLRTEFSSN